jgi:predicted SprT family Zn-dependent metalloprotease
MMKAITQEEYKAFQRAYDYFNAELFGDSLPDTLITLQRNAKTYGYLAADRFAGRANANITTHELALNPDHFGRTDEEILSTLVHEMVHLWQHAHGTPPRKSYHDREWAAKMKEVGLHPSDTGQPGGKETGQTMTHYIVAGGPYAQAAAKLKENGFELRWQSRIVDDKEKKTRKAKTASKTKYTCPSCGQNAWAKLGATLICGECYDDGEGEIHVMEFEG